MDRRQAACTAQGLAHMHHVDPPVNKAVHIFDACIAQGLARALSGLLSTKAGHMFTVCEQGLRVSIF